MPRASTLGPRIARQKGLFADWITSVVEGVFGCGTAPSAIEHATGGLMEACREGTVVSLVSHCMKVTYQDGARAGRRACALP